MKPIKQNIAVMDGNFDSNPLSFNKGITTKYVDIGRITKHSNKN
jgi:hypothetical protein